MSRAFGGMEARHFSLIVFDLKLTGRPERGGSELTGSLSNRVELQEMLWMRHFCGFVIVLYKLKQRGSDECVLW